MSNQQYDVTGLELSPQMQNVTGRKLQRLGLQVKRVIANTRAIPFPDGAFSTVISTFPSNYITQRDTMKEIHRVLSRGGRVVILGLCVKFTSGWKKLMTKVIFGEPNEGLIGSFSKEAQKIGFSTEVTELQKDDYHLLIFILRKEDEK